LAAAVANLTALNITGSITSDHVSNLAAAVANLTASNISGNITASHISDLSAAVANLTASNISGDINASQVIGTFPSLTVDTLTVNNSANIANLIVPGYSDLHGNVTAFGNLSANVYLQDGTPNLELINLHLVGNLIVDQHTTVSNLVDEVMFTKEINFEPGAPPPTLFSGTVIDSPVLPVSGASFGISSYSLLLANASVASVTNTFSFTVTGVPGTLCLAQASLTYTTPGGVTSYSSVSQTGTHQYQVVFTAPSGNFQTSDRMYILVNFTQYA